jgi:hypothetical protein
MKSDTTTDRDGRMTISPVPQVHKHRKLLRVMIEFAAKECRGRLINYSGKLMYGKRCLGVVVDNPVLFGGYLGVYTVFATDPDIPTAVLNGMWWDQHGRDKYIVYFPDLAPPGINVAED